MYNNLINFIVLCGLSAIIYSQVDYNSDIQPIFYDNCTQCHGSSAGLNLSSYANIMQGSNNGDVIIPYDYVNSELWQRINSGQMPPGNNDLTNVQVNLIAQWIDEGALAELDCDPTIACGEAETCCDDLLYPTTCCAENCDEPIGECGGCIDGEVNNEDLPGAIAMAQLFARPELPPNIQPSSHTFQFQE